MIKPGPPFLSPHQSPGGVVIHVYDAITGELLRERRIGESVGLDDLDVAATEDAAATFGVPIPYLVGYDGDTGERMAWLELMRPSDELD